MSAAVIVFPGSNCDRDVARAVTQCMGMRPHMVWHKETEVPPVDVIVLPGGFSHGDYLRSGAMAARAPVMRTIAERVAAGVAVLGICNGFQILAEAGLLPGAFLRNASLRFVCLTVTLRVDTVRSPFTAGYDPGQILRIPVAHHDGNYYADADTLACLYDEDRIAFRYVTERGDPDPDTNPNGSCANIAGILDARGRVLGMMPHPERAVDPLHGGTDGVALFRGLVDRLG